MAAPLTDIYFLHIPKTAGSSLASVIRCAYPTEEAIPVFEWQDLLRMSREQINGYRCYTGHFGTGLYSLLDREVPGVTLLRDPFEQTISHMAHVERIVWPHSVALPLMLRAGRRLWDRVRLPAIRKRLESPYVAVLVNNFQTQTLGTELDLTPWQGKPYRSFLSYYIRQAERTLHPAEMDRTLERAKRRLDAMAVVGTVERFAESLELICDFLGIPAPAKPPEENVARGRTPRSRYRDSGRISPDMTVLVDAYTEHDRELYAYACRLLEERLARKAASTVKNETVRTARP